jgi:hypothetical protein
MQVFYLAMLGLRPIKVTGEERGNVGLATRSEMTGGSILLPRMGGCDAEEAV